MRVSAALTVDTFLRQYGDDYRYELADGELIDGELIDGKPTGRSC